MKTENLDETLELLFEYYNLIQLQKKADETLATVLELNNKISQSISDAEKAHYQIEVVNNIQRLISSSDRNRYNFKYYILRYGLYIAITKLEEQLKQLKCKIEEL